MSDHTQTKLCVSSQAPTILKAFDFMGETSVIVGSASGYDNSGFFPSQEQGVANARRLVACWNACVGVPTDALEQIEGLAKAVLPYHQIKAQRDALLAALKTIAGDDPYRVSSAGLIARAAIEAAEKGGTP